MEKLLIIWTVINAFAFVLYGADKKRAKQNRWRISEKALLLIALLGGAVGAYAAMLMFHHKTRKPLFKIGVPCFAMLHIVCICLYASA